MTSRAGDGIGTRAQRIWRFAAIRGWAVAASFLLLGILAVLALSRFTLFPNTQYLLWKPLLASKTPITICVADNSSLENKGMETMTELERVQQAQIIAEIINSRKAPGPVNQDSFSPTTPFSDANVAHQISRWLGDHNLPAVLRSSSSLTMQDFRRGPVVLIGGFDNPWTVIVLSDLRFSPRVDVATNTYWIRDAQNPTQRNWTKKVIGGTQPTSDYAVITRLLDTGTDSWVLTVGGIGQHATEAAGLLLVDPLYARSLPTGIRSAKNFQMVVRASVINGSTGPPQVVAFYAW